jgi:hypothetical protein
MPVDAVQGSQSRGGTRFGTVPPPSASAVSRGRRWPVDRCGLEKAGTFRVVSPLPVLGALADHKQGRVTSSVSEAGVAACHLPGSFATAEGSVGRRHSQPHRQRQVVRRCAQRRGLLRREHRPPRWGAGHDECLQTLVVFRRGRRAAKRILQRPSSGRGGTKSAGFRTGLPRRRIAKPRIGGRGPRSSSSMGSFRGTARPRAASSAAVCQAN